MATVTAPSSYADAMRRAAARSPDVEALILSGERLMYATLVARAETRARELRGLGIGRGDHVGVLMPNAGFKAPQLVRFISEWPMSATKIQKFRLRDALLAELEEKRG